MSDLARQLAMNPQTWNALRQKGVTEQTELRLDFAYEAPTRDAADKLIKLLKDETDYDLSEPAGFGPFMVSGTTQKTKISLEILNQWVDWMVAAGRQSGGCAFDGWGAQVPAKMR